MDDMQKNELWMQEALALAALGRYTTRPNPCVGAVLVKNDQIIASGWHQQRGEAHAEIHALEKAGSAAQGATCYVTLEPCAHYGHTPPCCEALVKAGVKRVVVAMCDPNPKVNGQGIAYLQNKGIEVCVGILEKEAKELNKAFIKRMTQNKPWVSLKLAMTLDGKVGDFSGNSQWISSECARREVQALRAVHAAVMSTATTVIADNARLTVRELPSDLPSACSPKFKQPLRVLLDRTLKIDFEHTFFQQEGEILIYHENTNNLTEPRSSGNGVNSPLADARGSVRGKIEIVPMLVDEKGYLSIPAILEDLSQREINSVLVEAGGRFATELLQSDCVDEWIIYVASKILGERAQSAFAIDKALELSESLAFQFQSVSMCGPDVKIVALSSLRKQGSSKNPI